MLGSVMFRVLSESSSLAVYGAVRGSNTDKHFSAKLHENFVHGVEVENQDSLLQAFAAIQPDVVINCVGLVKQSIDINSHLKVISINSLLPHRLAMYCRAIDARLIHISTDCVFTGVKGGYLETDFPDAGDLYGRSKLLGEVDYPHALTLRTSIIGHELLGYKSLISWFLRQEGSVEGFTRAIFSGLPTVELATLVRDVVLPRRELHGVFHVSASPISKFKLLELVADVYEKKIQINPSEALVINRSLNSERFKKATGYMAPDWPTLVRRMHQYK